jgi:excisionase family DNA binding protein
VPQSRRIIEVVISDSPFGSNRAAASDASSRGTDSGSRDSIGRFLTVADTAEILNVEVGDVVGLIRSGELPAIRVGTVGRWRVERPVLETYIESMYEETRRRALWEQSEFANLPELSGGRIIRPSAHESN